MDVEVVGTKTGPAFTDNCRKCNQASREYSRESKRSLPGAKDGSLIHAQAYLACAQAVLSNTHPLLKLAYPSVVKKNLAT